MYEVGDYTKLRTSLDVKLHVLRMLMRQQRHVYHEWRVEFKRALIEYKASYLQSLLFRTRMVEFLQFIDQADRIGDIELIAGKDQDLIKSLNKSLPIRPLWSDSVPDDRMRLAVPGPSYPSHIYGYPSLFALPEDFELAAEHTCYTTTLS